MALLLAASVAACDSHGQAASTTSSQTIESSSTSTSAEPDCAAHLPDRFATVVSEERVTVADVRAIRVGTLPPDPTQLLLPSHAADDPALFCIAWDGHNSYNSYWVASEGEVGIVCVSTFEAGLPETPTWNGCD